MLLLFIFRHEILYKSNKNHVNYFLKIIYISQLVIYFGNVHKKIDNMRFLAQECATVESFERVANRETCFIFVEDCQYTL